MHINFSALLLILLTLGMSQAVLYAGIEPQIEYIYYDVTPEEGQNLSNSLFNASPIFHEGKNYAGLTKSSFSYRFDTVENTIDNCQAENLEVKVKCFITLPRLNGGEDDLQEMFAKYQKNLQDHELEHCRITAYYANTFREDMLKIDTVKCSKIKSKVEVEYKKKLSELDGEQRRYDLRTVHGKYEGADIRKHIQDMEQETATQGRPEAPAARSAGKGLMSIDSESSIGSAFIRTKMESGAITENNEKLWMGLKSFNALAATLLSYAYNPPIINFNRQPAHLRH